MLAVTFAADVLSHLDGNLSILTLASILFILERGNGVEG
ncbi:MAG: hypothetical protein ETSY2_35135 [Candidatus Entotheonella gemina]|uniref:Uncharacterized protein n=1 Tax=Candidatus Entotheonella gemina TaxID=1429439 RepID=W4LXJ2_9BACT|nr:MAG: hypothetical protein ETSY2_35135 [Candidatus Entotheonella gemina]